jgi:hypothetical protein
MFFMRSFPLYLLWCYCMVAITTARWRRTSGSGQGAEARRSVSFRFGHSLVFLCVLSNTIC